MGETRSFTVGTAVDASLWILATGMAMFFIFQKQIQLHRQWITRSFACALIFIEVRVITGLTGWNKYSEAIVWGCVAAVYPLADLALQWQDLRRPRAVPARVR